jgi:hypothetical protein
MLKKILKLNDFSIAILLSSPQTFIAWLKDLASTPATVPA